jgi:hypothetical protein
MITGRDTPEDVLVNAVEAVLSGLPGCEFRSELYRLWQLVRDYARERQHEAAAAARRKGRQPEFEPIGWMGSAGFPAFRDALTAAIPRLDWRSITVEFADQAGTTQVHVRRSPAVGTEGN